MLKKTFIAIIVSGLLTSFSFAETIEHSAMDHSSMEHSMHDMHQSHAMANQENSEQTMSSQSSNMHKMANIGNITKLVPAETFELPTKQPLQTLPLVKNQSKTANEFKAELNPTPTQVNLSPKNATELWLYNEQLLPIIDVNVGDQIDISVKNNLPEPTTIHWHGLAVPPSQDGNPHDPIKPNEEGKYQFEITPQMVGSHWFHPHTYGLTGKQVAQGLAGIFIVRDPNDPLKHIPEQNLFFSDMKLDENVQIAPNSMLDIMNGREGQFALINGQLQPEITLTGTERLRLWNGNSARYLNLQFDQPEIEVYLVGNDGGLIEQPVQIKSLFLTPGERAEILVHVKTATKFELISKAYDRDKMGPVPAEQDIVVASVKTQLDTENKTIEIPQTLTSIADLGEPTIKRKVILTEEMMPMRFLINGKTHDMDRIDFTAKRGEVEEWEITNSSHMDHNFHLHGDQFVVKEFELNNVITKPEFKLRKDTINIKPGQTVRILTVQNQAGIRMYHCHILEHEDMGMMGQLEVL